MLSDDIKKEIRTAYNALMEKKSLTPRWGQRQMIATIAQTLARIPRPGEDAHTDKPAICIVEAGTGTGKTIAYTVAAIPMAQALGKRLVVATATIALQEQFILKDLPDIRHNSGLQFTYALAKGRRRYVCLSKLDRLLVEGDDQASLLPLYADDAAAVDADSMGAGPIYAGMLDALGRGEWDGDRDNWVENVADGVWYAVTTDHSQCSGRRCPNISQCSFFRARESLQNADIIVTNHDLVLADLALGGGAILPEPEDSIYIFDEGHHLPEKALAHFANFCRLHTTIAWLQDSVKALSQAAPVLATLDSTTTDLQQLLSRMEEAISSLQAAEQAVASLFVDAELDEGRDRQQLRLEHGLVPPDLQQIAVTLTAQFEQMTATLARLEDALAKALDDDFSKVDKVDVETWHINIGGMLSRAEGVLSLWHDYAVREEGETSPQARWMTLLNGGGQFGFELRSSPVLAADILQDCLWMRAAGVVVTSATLTALSSFERFKLHSGVPHDSLFQVVASPFNHTNAVFSVPKMDCDPGDANAHTKALIAELPQLLSPEEGSLVLFSSRRQMLEVYEGLSGKLGVTLLLQGDFSKQEILRRHRAAIDAGEGSAIFGLASFTEGVDLPGDYCRHVIIAKIPFAVPDSPLEAALAEWVEAQGRNAFMEISVPDAALRLVQASGRLLRTEEDVGRVTLMDNRILTRRYGRAILESLPPFQRQLG